MSKTVMLILLSVILATKDTGSWHAGWIMHGAMWLLILILEIVKWRGIRR